MWTLERVTTMQNFVKDCTSLTTLNMDNLDNSIIGPTNNYHSVVSGQPGYIADREIAKEIGAKEFGRELGIETCTALETLSAKDSNIWMVYNNRGRPGNEYYNASDKNNIYYFTENKMEFEADAGTTVTIASNRDYIDLITDRDESNVPVTNPTADPLPDATKNINMVNGDLNPNGAGHLAPGVYTINSELREDPAGAPMPDTYYRIAYLGEVPYKVEGLEDDDPDLVKVEGNNNTFINTRNMYWDEPEKVIDRESNPIKITYENAAIDTNGKKHDVEISITKITFKDCDNVPTHPGSDRVPHDANSYVPTDRYYFRTVLQANKDDGVQFHNYVRIGEPESLDPMQYVTCLSQGSGTDIEFTVRIVGAPEEGTSFVFRGEDLDVAHSQNWNNSDTDACYDNLPIKNNTYGENGEAFILGEGNDISTLSFAEHTGLYEKDGMIMTTGTDPSTSWSEFTVKADAAGAKYTWTSGISCSTYALRNTKPQDLGSIELPLQGLKEVITGKLDDSVFDFTLEYKSVDPNEMPDPVDENGDPISTLNAQNDGQGNFIFDSMFFMCDGDNPLIDGSDTIPYFPGTDPGEPDTPTENTHGQGIHNSVTYTFEVKEVQGTDPNVLKYDDTVHTVKITISTPENDEEMARGIKADIYVDDELTTTVWSKEVGASVPVQDLTFENNKVDPIEVPLEVTKYLNGRFWKDSDTFTAEFTGEDADTPMPENNQVIIDDSGKPIVDFDGNIFGYTCLSDPITFELEDIRKDDPDETEKTFTYTFTELTPTQKIPGIIYSQETCIAEVTVYLDTYDPDDPKLDYVVGYYVIDSGGRQIPIAYISFVNFYEAKPTTYVMKAEKDLYDVNEEEEVELEGDEFEFIIKPIGTYAEIAPMPKDAEGEGKDRTYTKTNGEGGVIAFKDDSDDDDGLVFDFEDFRYSDVTYEMLIDEGVEFEYEIYEVIPEDAIDNGDGTYTKDDNGNVTVYDGTHHTRKITLKIRTVTPTTGDPYDELYVEPSQDDEGEPTFENYCYEQKYVDLKLIKEWDDANDQDKMRPESIDVTITSDEKGVDPKTIEVKGDDWSASETLPIYEFNNDSKSLDSISYSIKETKVPDGYEVSYNPDFSTVQFSEEGEFELTITNKHIPGQGVIIGDETYGGREAEQIGTPDYNGNPNNPVTPTNLVKPDKEGATISDDGLVVTIPGEGTYTLNLDDGTITFKPEPDFIGDPTPITVEGKDLQDNSVTGIYQPHVVDNVETINKTRKITYVYEDGSPVLDESGLPLVKEFTVNFNRTGVVDPKTGKITEWYDWTPVDIPEEISPEIDGYTPDKDKVALFKDATPDNWPDDEVVTYKKNEVPTIEGPTWVDGSPVTSIDYVRKTQTGILTFKPGDLPIVSAKLIDPNTGLVTDALAVDVYENGVKIGTYVLNPNGKANSDGTVSYEITFTPYGDYVGTPPSITLRVFDEAGNYADGIYQPEVIKQAEPKVVPDSSDSNKLGLWIALTAVAVCGVLGILFIRRKYSK